MRLFATSSLLLAALFPLCAQAQTSAAAQTVTKPVVTLDEFMNSSEIADAQLSPDGTAAVIAVDRPDWQANRFRSDLWLWSRAGNTLRPLTHSGHDSSPQWSPDGRYVAFISDRATNDSTGDGSNSADAKAADRMGGAAADGSNADEPGRIWIIAVNGGEALPLYGEKLDVHAFAWTPDSASLVFSVTEPQSKDQQEAQKTEWKDVIRWREQERGDVLLSLPVSAALHAMAAPAGPLAEVKQPSDKPPYPESASVLTHSALQISEIVPSQPGDQIAFETQSISHRVENPADTEMFLVPAHGGEARQLTHNNGAESHLHWDASGKKIYFLVAKGSGSIEGAYHDVQGRLYSFDLADEKATRMGKAFNGSWEDFTITASGRILATGLEGMDQHIYSIDGDKATAIGTNEGTYEHVRTALRGDGVLFTHSTVTDPTQVFVAAGPLSIQASIQAAQQITHLNPIFDERAKVQWEPFRWKSDDGTDVEGVLIFPPGKQATPGKQGEKNLKMLTLIHGGPEDADGNRFGANWYDWATLAASQGYLVFRPNYRGSTGYGDAFMLAIQPHLVSAPGRDILSGVDALVKQGIADPDHLSIGGYSYGGYMTNWLITQTTRFKAAVTGAGAVEHAANWGNDDLTFDDAWYLSGAPWEKPELYQSEAALFQINKVTTPTHIVGGNADVRVSYLEQVLLERALERLQIPHALLVFPGENHPLDKNPWHGYIKVREELKWLAKYGE